jgi:hypothetical protein
VGIDAKQGSGWKAVGSALDLIEYALFDFGLLPSWAARHGVDEVERREA